MLCIFAERDKTCEGGDERSRAADIDAEKQFSVIFSELRKKHGARHVTDDLAGKSAYEKRIFLKKKAEYFFDERDPCHIARKNEKRAECEKKRIVNLFQCISVEKHECKRHDQKSDPIRDHAENDHDGKRKERKIDHRTAAVDLHVIVFDSQGLFFDEDQTAERDDRDRNRERERHDAHKFARGDIKLGIYVKVLRIAERCQHTAEVGGNILHNERKRHILLLLCRSQNHKSKRQKGKKGHIVSKEHRPDKGDVHECKDAKLRIFAKSDDASCERYEKAKVSESADASERTEKTGECPEVKITEILGIGRNRERRGKSRRQSNRKNGILTYECADSGNCRVKECAGSNGEAALIFGAYEDMLRSDRMCHFKNPPNLDSQTNIYYHILNQKSICFLKYFMMGGKEVLI